MATTHATPIRYRKTKTGEWVAYGSASDIHPGATVEVVKRDGTVKTERIESTGRTFAVDGVTMVYGYLAGRSSASPGSCTCGRHRRYRECKTGGNCSSFGDSRSCGGCDCDGY